MTASTHYPVFLDLRGRECVVLGDNDLAVAKAEGLRAAGARVTHHRRAYEPGDLSGAYLAVDASAAPRTQAAVRLEADRERVLLNVADVAPRCDWIAPAVVRRGPLQIAISTSGESPFLAATLRMRLEKLIGEEWGPLTALMGRLRRSLRRHGVDVDRQQRAYRELVGSDVRRLLAHSPRAAEALAARIEAEARSAERNHPMGQVTLVGAGPGDPALITHAGREALMDADVVLHDALVDADSLNLCRPSALVIDVGKRAGQRSTPQAEITAALVAFALQGNRVVRLKGGDPFVFGRGGEEVAALADAGIPVQVIPGVSSVLAAPCAAGIPLTFRGVAASVAVVTGHRLDGDDAAVEGLAAHADTLVVLMPGDLDSLAARLGAVLGPRRPAALVSAATTTAQQVVRAPVGQLGAVARASGIVAPLTVIVGNVVDVLSRERGVVTGGSTTVEQMGIDDQQGHASATSTASCRSRRVHSLST